MNKVCSGLPGVCIGVNCAQFASCMRREIEALNYLGLCDEATEMGASVINIIKESLK
jgi:hypothetical protein